MDAMVKELSHNNNENRDFSGIEEIFREYETNVGFWFSEKLLSASMRELGSVVRILDWAGWHPIGYEKKIRYLIGSENWEQLAQFGMPAAQLLINVYIDDTRKDQIRFFNSLKWFEPWQITEALTRIFRDPVRGHHLCTLITTTDSSDWRFLLSILTDLTLPSHHQLIAAISKHRTVISPWLCTLLTTSDLSDLTLITSFMRKIYLYPEKIDERVLFWYGEQDWEYLSSFGQEVVFVLLNRVYKGSVSDTAIILHIIEHYPDNIVISALLQVLQDARIGKETARAFTSCTDLTARDYLVHCMANQSAPGHEELILTLRSLVSVIGRLLLDHLLSARYQDLFKDVYLMDSIGVRATSLAEQIVYAIGSGDWNTVIEALPIISSIRKDELVSLLLTRLMDAGFDELQDISELLRILYRYPNGQEARVLYWCGQQDWDYLRTYGDAAVIPLLRIFPSASDEAQSAIMNVLRHADRQAVGMGLALLLQNDLDNILFSALVKQKESITAEYLVHLFSDTTLLHHKTILDVLKRNDVSCIRWLTLWMKSAPYDCLHHYSSLLDEIGWYPVGSREKARYAVGNRDWGSLITSWSWQDTGEKEAFGRYLTSQLPGASYREVIQLATLLHDTGYSLTDDTQLLYYYAGQKDWSSLQKGGADAIDLAIDLIPSADYEGKKGLFSIFESFPDWQVAARIYHRLHNPELCVLLVDALTSLSDRSFVSGCMRIWTAMWHQYPLTLRTLLSPGYNRLLSWMLQAMERSGIDVIEEISAFFLYMHYLPSGKRRLLYAIGRHDHETLDKSHLSLVAGFRIYLKSGPDGRRRLCSLFDGMDDMDTDLMDRAAGFVKDECISPSDMTITFLLSLIQGTFEKREAGYTESDLSELKSEAIRDYLCEKSDEMDNRSFVLAGQIIHTLGSYMTGLCYLRYLLVTGAYERLAQELMTVKQDDTTRLFSVIACDPTHSKTASTALTRHLTGYGDNGWNRLLTGMSVVYEKECLDNLIYALSREYIPVPSDPVKREVTEWILCRLPVIRYSTLHEAVSIIDRFYQPFYPDPHPSAIYYWLGKREWGVVKQSVQGSGGLEPLLLALDHESRSNKKVIIQILGQMSDSDTGYHLVPYLMDEDPDIRALCAWALGQYQGSNYVRHLIGVLSDSYMVARENALVALMRKDRGLIVQSIVSDIIPGTMSDTNVSLIPGSGTILHAIRQVRDLEAVNYLVSVLSDESVPGHNQLIALLIQEPGICEWLDSLPKENSHYDWSRIRILINRCFVTGIISEKI